MINNNAKIENILTKIQKRLSFSNYSWFLQGSQKTIDTAAMLVFQNKRHNQEYTNMAAMTLGENW